MAKTKKTEEKEVSDNETKVDEVTEREKVEGTSRTKVLDGPKNQKVLSETLVLLRRILREHTLETR